MIKMTLKEMQDAVDNAPVMKGSVFFIPGANVYCNYATSGAFSIAYLSSAIEAAKKEQAKEVEWVNGDAAYHPTLSEGQVARWVGYGAKKELSIIEYLEGCLWKLDRVWTEELSKPESPEEQEKREREEAAYDLYTSCAHAGGCTSYEIFVSEPVILKFWLSVVDKTNYRKADSNNK